MTAVASRPGAESHARAPEASGGLPGSERLRRWIGFVAFGVLAYVPILLTHRGRVEADTKTYLFLDPGRLLESALSMWDPKIGMGTVTHQTIGYLFPMGPFFWVTEQALGLPSWVAQRLWLGTILFAAGIGVWYLFRVLGMRGPGVAVGVLAYTFTPYVLQYSARFSVLLGPWAALPWMIGLIALALRRGGWRYPALFAITVQLVGGVNATALIFAGVGPVLWIPYAVWGLREASLRRAWQVLWRTALLTVITSLWWMSGLWAQGSYGLDILKYTETVETVAGTSYVNEILRGLGYWFFYFRDIIGQWNEPVTNYTDHTLTIMTSYAVPALALLAAGLVRWRHRIYFVGLILVGVVIAVGASPYDNPSWFGGMFKAFAASSSAGLALRSTGRAVPLIALGLAALLAAGVSALAGKLDGRGHRWIGVGAAALIGGLVILNFTGIWSRNLYSKYLERAEAVPTYWQQALENVNSQPHDTRVLALPGSDFAAYRWGVTIDPIEPGLLDRPYVARELVPWGTPGSASLLEALDRRIQAGDLAPDAIAPVARLMAVGDVLLRLDLQTKRYNLIRSNRLWTLFTPAPNGLQPPRTFGTGIPGPSELDAVDEESITDAAKPPVSPPPVAVFGVDNPLPIIHATPVAHPLVVAGDANGIIDAATLGLLQRDSTVLYAASYATRPAQLRSLVADGATLVLTDTNRKQPHRWTGVQDSSGNTEQPNEKPLVPDPRDARLDVFPGETTSSQTVARQRGVASVVASSYGAPGLSPQPGYRAERAIDGDPHTAWEVAGEKKQVVGQRIQVKLDQPITTGQVKLLQPVDRPRGRWISKATLTFDGGDPVTVALGPESRTDTNGGQTVRFPKRTFGTFEVRIDDIHEIPSRDWKISAKTGESVRWQASYVGLAEIGLRDDRPGAAPVKVDEVIHMPTDLLTAVGTSSLRHPLVLSMSRDGQAGVEPKTDTELDMRRQFSLPTARSFDVSGSARINPSASSDTIDAVLGIPGAASGGVTATSTDEMFNDVSARASAAIDGDPRTAWTTPMDSILGQSVTVRTPKPVSFDHLALQLANDTMHSVPTQITITSGDGASRVVAIPPVASAPADGSSAPVTVTFPAIRGTSFTFTIDAVREVTRLDYATLWPAVMPVGITELGIPGVTLAAPPATLPGACRSDLVTIDGRPVPIRVSGATGAAISQSPLAIEGCGSPIELGPGSHVLRTVKGLDSAIDVDTLAFSSAAGGAAAPVSAITTATTATTAPTVKVLHQGPTSATVRIDRTASPAWFVLGQSQNVGWQAKLDGKDLGGSTLVNGYANGWVIPATKSGGPVTITLAWTPQRVVNLALLLSVVALAICLGIVVVAAIRARRRSALAASAPAGIRIEAPQPALVDLAGGGGANPDRAVAVVTALASGVAAAALVRPWCGIVVGVLVALALLRPRWRSVLRIAPFVALVVCGVYVTLEQRVHRYVTDIMWPSRFWRVRDLAWLAILLLAANAVVGVVRKDEPVERAEPVEPVDESTEQT